jgi:Tfp pilus assembly protein PilF
VKKTPRNDREGASAGRKAKRRQPHSGLARLVGSPGRTALVLFAIAFLLYANTIGNDFVWDDLELITQNPTMGKLSAQQLASMFTSNFWSGYKAAGYYRPAVAISYHVQYRLFRGNPAGFHFVNTVWNALTVVLIFLFVYLLFRNAILGVVTALVFAVHPLHTENVAWISGRTDVMAAMFAVASLVSYVLFRQRKSWPWLGAALVAFMASLMAKESAAFIPLVVAFLELPPLRALLSPRAGAAGGRATAAGVAGYAVVLAVYFVLRHQALGLALSSYDRYAPGALGVVALPLSIFAGYVGKLVFPFRLNAEWDAHVPGSFADAHAIAGFLLLAALVALVVRWRRVPEVVLGAVILLFGVAPVLNIIPIGEISAERFLYIPSLGFALLLGALFAPAWVAASPGVADLATMRGARRPFVTRERGRELVWVLVIVLVAFAARTMTRGGVWKNEQVLFTETVKAAPESPRARVNLGDVAMRQGRLNDAIALYRKALEIDPDFGLALSNLAGVYAQQQRLDDAAPLIERAVRNHPDNPGLLSNLGSLYYEQGRYEEAEVNLRRSLELDPEQPTAGFNLGLIEFDRKNWTAARARFLLVADLGGHYHMALYYLAMIEATTHSPAAARQYAQRFLALHPQNDEYRERARRLLAGP